jgi:hypothetical protein
LAADPNWLFSATAQSAAAVFAIVAGFITTRILGLAAERRAIGNQILEREVRLQKLGEHKAELVQDKVEIVVERFREDVKEFIVAEDKPPPREIISGAADKDVPEDVLEPEFDGVLAQWAKVKEYVASNKHTIDHGEEDGRRWITKQGADPAEFDLDLMDHLYEQTRRELAPFGSLLPTFRLPPASASSDPRNEIDSKLNETDLEMQILAREVQNLRQRVPSLVMPRSGWWAIGILAYIGAFSVILPLSLMPATSEERWMRPLTLGLFASGLAALMVYIVIEFISMLRPPEDTGESPQPRG